MTTINRRWYSGMGFTEDWWAVWLGLIMFVAGLFSITGVDLVGWMTKTSVWIDPAKAIKVSGASYQAMHPLLSLLTTYLVFTLLTCTGAYCMRLNIKKFFYGWTVIFTITWVCWFVGNNAHLAAVPQEWDKYGITWGLALGGGASFILALIVGLFIGNFTKGFAASLYEAAKPEWYIKTAIVFLGIKVGLMSMEAAGFTFELALCGMIATFVAYMLFWPIVYTLARKVFKLPRQWAATLSSGISICGVSAAVATGGAIRARTIIPVMVSMLIVVFAMIELLILPPLYTATLGNEPIVAGSAMGMTVKTDGADAAAGAILDEMMRAKAAGAGTMWQEGWILTSAVMTKIWIDMFIGLWAFVLAIIWVYKVENKPGQVIVHKSEIWHRFPKFVLGYFFTWFVYLGIAVFLPNLIEAAMVGAKTVQSPMRKMMFMLTFVSIGIITDFSKLKGMGRLVLLYAIALFFIIAPIALIVAYIFHHGMTPPLS